MKARTVKPPEERRREIIGAARFLFAERGYDGTSVSAIVARAGVAQGTFYLYFPSKDHVLAAVLEAASAEYVAAVRGCLFGRWFLGLGGTRDLGTP